jgi:hypothetical protein
VQVELPETLENAPSEHGKQDLEPSVPEYMPAVQFKQTVWPMELE